MYGQSTPSAFSRKNVVTVTLTLLLLSLLGMWGCPYWNVFRQEMRGKAALREAEFTRQIATLDAQAEIERAKGVSEANKIIGRSLQGNEAYLRYLWIQSLNSGNSETIYVPTETNLPILESTRRMPSVAVED